MKISDDTLRGRTVISNDGLAVGEVTRLVIDTASWRVASMEVELRKDTADRIGIKRSMFRPTVVQIAVDTVQSVGDAIVLAIDLASLRTAEAAAEQAPPVH
jgi:sporulation protein YlmC with PRC-barrel domain